MACTGEILVNAANDYPPIRTLLGASAAELPDETIEQPPFLHTAEAIVKAGIANWAAITSGDDLNLLKAGVQALTAALLCQAFERGDTGQFRVGDYWEQGSKMDWRDKAMMLLGLAQRSLGALSTRTWTRRVLVAVAGPTRSGSRVPGDLEQWVERVVPRFVDWVAERGEDDEWHEP